MMNRNRSGKKKGVAKPYKVNTAVRFTTTGSSGTFYAPVISLLPNASSVTEATQFAALFDEARCTGVSVHTRAEGIQANGAWAFAFDPVNAGAYSSTVGILVASQKMGPFAYVSSTATSLGIVPVNATGYIKKYFKTLPSLPTNGASSADENVGNGWFACSDTGALVGFVKFACDAFSGATLTLDTFIVYHMEYRSRT